MDILSADIAGGRRYVTAVVRVAHLGTAVEAGPRIETWYTNFKFKGTLFRATASRAIDGSLYYLSGTFPEHSGAPGFEGHVDVTGSFDETRNEIRVVFPRDLIGHTRDNSQLTDIIVVSATGAGTLASQATSAYAEETVDATDAPGPTTSVGRPSCVGSA
jgi:hypothetical protein